MKQIVFLVILMMAALTGDALADPSGTRIGVLKGDLGALLKGKLVNASESGGTDTWQEVHCVTVDELGEESGDIFELAQGPGDPVDPSKVVGTWNVFSTSRGGGNEVVCYSYSGGQRYCFQVYEDSGIYRFYDQDGTEEKAFGEIVPYEGSCP